MSYENVWLVIAFGGYRGGWDCKLVASQVFFHIADVFFCLNYDKKPEDYDPGSPLTGKKNKRKKLSLLANEI